MAGMLRSMQPAHEQYFIISRVAAGIDNQDDQPKVPAVFEICRYEPSPFSAHGFGHLGIAVAGQVDKMRKSR